VPLFFLDGGIDRSPTKTAGVLIESLCRGNLPLPQSGFPIVALYDNGSRIVSHMTGEILATRAMVLAGDYWTVWPAVFHANLVLSERGEHEIIYGLTNRSFVTDPLWVDVPRDQLCVAAPVRDIGSPEHQEEVLYMAGAGFHFSRIERHDTLDIFELGDLSRCNRYSKRDPRWFRRASAILADGVRQLLKTLLIELHL
jgi:hypothetical protein